ncbi:hypothetical protein [Streptomyces sp. NPDC002088]|uniref:hypothetical protein n=1 Tax=Streptomyces sp. NPDC002088 TaxID=3154665 RepID=UPI003318991A
MLKIEGLAPCDGSTVEVDPWVPLKVSWDVDREAQPLYLLIAGASGGYLELKVHPESGALLSLTVIDLPVEVGYVELKSPAEIIDSLVPVFDVAEWGDVSGIPPGKRMVRLESEMTYSQSPDRFVLSFSCEDSRSRVRCGSASVEISESGGLARLIATIGRG